MLYTADNLLAYFPRSYFQRGRVYQQDGKVHGLEMARDGRSLRARVVGTDFAPYEVSVDIDADASGGLLIEGFCSCPVGYNCKHVVATLLQALEEADTDPLPRLLPHARPASHLPIPSQQGGYPSPSPAPASSKTLDGWFQRLNRAAHPNAYPPSIVNRILYLLHPLDQAQHLGVNVVSVRLLKGGGYGQPRHYNPYNAVSGQPARYVTETDIGILRDLARQDRLTGTLGADLLRRMLATERCHWLIKDNPPLRSGEVRTARPCWDVDERGLTRLRFEIDDPDSQLFALEPFWYVDTARHLSGPVETSLPARLAAELVDSPAMSPDELPKVHNWLAAHLPDTALPPPPALPVMELTEVKPRPRLSLYSRSLHVPYYHYRANEAHCIDGARLSFDYDGRTVTLDEQAQRFDHYKEGRILRLNRDPDVEANYARQLVALGFRSLDSFFNVYWLPQESFKDIGLPNEDNWLHFMLVEAAKLRSQGWQIEAEADFRFNLVTPDDWYAELDEGSGIDWFGLTLGVEVDGMPINLLPVLVQFLRRLPSGAPRTWLDAQNEDEMLTVTLPDGRLLALPVKRVRAILSVLIELYDQLGVEAEVLRLPLIQVSRLAELEAALRGESLRWQGGEELRNLAERLRRGPSPVEAPSGLQATLRGYQLQGLAWLQFLRELNLGGILADDMGLGKTVQALAHILVEKNAGRLDRPCLVVAPTSLMATWRGEAERFTPSLSLLTLRGPERRRYFKAVPDYDVVLTTYPLLPRDFDALKVHEYHLLILDEAQAIKNPKAQAGIVARSLNARHRLCLTGTPMENHLGELWSLFNFLMPGLLGDGQQFKRLFRRPIEQFADAERQALLVKRIAPFMLRRTKEQVAADLPEKTEMVRTVELLSAQRDLYESIRLAMEARIRQEIQRKGLSRSHIVILDALLKLRQVCCDPRLLKLESARKVKQSAKLQLLLEMLPELVEEGRRILLFSQFTAMLALIETELRRLKIDYVKLTGQTRDRVTPINRFQAGEVPVFIISLKAGGVGLNLTAADTVIHYDPWWNPAVEDQATDRAHRIGQDKPVFVYKLFTEGTVEEKIRTLQERKRALTEVLLDAEKQMAVQWTDQDLDFLLAPLE